MVHYRCGFSKFCFGKMICTESPVKFQQYLFTLKGRASGILIRKPRRCSDLLRLQPRLILPNLDR